MVNDDGINAQGIIQLAQILSLEHNVMVVAPSTEMSATGHAISMHRSLICQKSNIFDLNAYSLSGTPSDCVKFALDVLCLKKPDMIISGINNGANIGTDILYSGTANAALEGAVQGVRSIAVSTVTDCNRYDYPLSFVKNNLDKLYSSISDTEYMLNINFPSSFEKEIKGVKVAPIGYRPYKDWYEKDEQGYYRLKGYVIEADHDYDDTDAYWFDRQYVTISPIKVPYNIRDSFFHKLRGLKW